MNLVDPCILEDPVTLRNPRRALDDQVRKSDAHSAPLNASITLRDILLKAGEAGSGGTNGTFDFDLLGMSSSASPFARPPFYCRRSLWDPLRDMVHVFSPFRLPTVANLNVVLQTGLKSRLKRKKMRRLNGGDSEPVKWAQGNEPSGMFTRGSLLIPNTHAKYLGLGSFANTFGCSHIASYCPSDTVNVSIVLRAGRWSLVTGCLDGTLYNPADLIPWANNERDTTFDRG